MGRVLVDTSVWVEMFRRGDASLAARALGNLLRDGIACVNGLIRAEVLSGARTRPEFRELSRLFAALPLLADPPDQWDRVAGARHRLARRGFQAAVADLLVAVSAAHHRAFLMTLDKDFDRIREAVRFRTLSLARH